MTAVQELAASGGWTAADAAGERTIFCNAAEKEETDVLYSLGHTFPTRCTFSVTVMLPTPRAHDQGQCLRPKPLAAMV